MVLRHVQPLLGSGLTTVKWLRSEKFWLHLPVWSLWTRKRCGILACSMWEALRLGEILKAMINLHISPYTEDPLKAFSSGITSWGYHVILAQYHFKDMKKEGIIVAGDFTHGEALQLLSIYSWT